MEKPTREEIRNGWTAESFNAYLKEREKQKADFNLSQEKVLKMQVFNNATFNPHEW